MVSWEGVVQLQFVVLVDVLVVKVLHRLAVQYLVELAFPGPMVVQCHHLLERNVPIFHRRQINYVINSKPKCSKPSQHRTLKRRCYDVTKLN